MDHASEEGPNPISLPANPRVRCFIALLIIFGCFGAAACSRTGEKELTADGVKYVFPLEHVNSFKEPGEGWPYARIRPPSMPFDLVYSARTPQRRKWSGADTPLVTHVSDFPARSTFERHESGEAVTVCRDDVPYYSCGLRVEDSGVSWSVVFSRDQVANSERIRRHALEWLKRYRKGLF